jgi:hypothetical protein
MITAEIIGLYDLALQIAEKTYQEISICELGNQITKIDKARTSKNMLLKRGVKEHVSIDINGKNGALPLDLSKQIFNWSDHFDISTNFGTIEHVAGGAYTAFENLHRWTKVGGVMIHVGPLAKWCSWHSPYHFETWFFYEFARRCAYKHIFTDLRMSKEVGKRCRNQHPLDRAVVCSMMVKTSESKFLTNDSFVDIHGIEGL